MILFVGDRPSKRMKPGARPFEGAACESRLYSWIAELIPFDDLDLRGVKKYELINQCDYAWADLYAAHIIGEVSAIIALGNNASKALGKIPHFKLPHPSGKNRQINDKEFINKKLQECKEWLKK